MRLWPWAARLLNSSSVITSGPSVGPRPRGGAATAQTRSESAPGRPEAGRRREIQSARRRQGQAPRSWDPLLCLRAMNMGASLAGAVRTAARARPRPSGGRSGQRRRGQAATLQRGGGPSRHPLRASRRRPPQPGHAPEAACRDAARTGAVRRRASRASRRSRPCSPAGRRSRCRPRRCRHRRRRRCGCSRS